MPSPSSELLLVDDSKVMREMIAACLRAEPGLAFSHAESGLEAIEGSRSSTTTWWSST